MKHFIQKNTFILIFLLATFSLFCQSNKPYAKNINITLENQELILTWNNPAQDSSIKNILIYTDSSPILSTNQLLPEKLVAILNKNQESYIISDKNLFSPYFAVLYQLKDDSIFDILIITENTTIYNEVLANKINDLFAVEIIKKPEEVEEITRQLSSRKEYEAELPEVILRLADIETAAELLDKALLRKLKMLKLTSGMDSISADEKEKRISFSDAMTSIEGVPVSDKVKTDLANWKKGNITFLSVFEQTLRRYGFVTEV